MHHNNPFIGCQTRNFLATHCCLSSKDLDLVEGILEIIRNDSPGGLIFTFARAQGAALERAIQAGISVELFYAACSLTDDIQDGDHVRYNIDLAGCVNVQAQIICAAFVALSELGAASFFAKQGIRMLCGQKIDLEFASLPDKPLGIESYNEMATKISGAAFGSYIGLAASVSNLSEQQIILWQKYGELLGKLIQITTDQESTDPRWMKIADKERDAYAVKIFREFRDLASIMPDSLHGLTAANLERTRCVFWQNSGNSM